MIDETIYCELKTVFEPGNTPSTILMGHYYDYTICFGGHYGKTLTVSDSFSALSNGFYWKIQTSIFIFSSQV